jgi:hypothetical protein
MRYCAMSPFDGYPHNYRSERSYTASSDRKLLVPQGCPSPQGSTDSMAVRALSEKRRRNSRFANSDYSLRPSSEFSQLALDFRFQYFFAWKLKLIAACKDLPTLVI